MKVLKSEVELLWGITVKWGQIPSSKAEQLLDPMDLDLQQRRMNITEFPSLAGLFLETMWKLVPIAPSIAEP